MGKTQNLGHLAHIVAYDASNNITLPANLTVTGTITGYATSASLGSYVPTSRTITINGTAYDLSANRSWNITSMIYPDAGIPLSTGSAWGTSITNNSANWNTAYGWGNHASAGYVPGARTITINGTAYDLTANRSWTVSGSDSTKLPLTGGTLTGNLQINAVSASWAEGLAISMPTTSAWAGIRLRRERSGYDGNWALGYTGLDSTDDFVFVAQNGVTQVNNILRLTKAGAVSVANGFTASTVAIGGSSNYLFSTGVWAGAGGYPGYQFTGGNTRFGFSSTSGAVDVYTDGNFYAGIDYNGSNNLVWHAGNMNAPNRSGTSYYQVETWLQLNGGHGLYCPSINNAHFYPNDASYGSWRILGSRNGWTGLHFGGANGITLMMNEGEFGFHREGVGWVGRFTSGRFYGTADYAVSAGSATDSSKLPLSGGTINGSLTVYGNYATTGEIYTGYQFKCGSGSDTPYLWNSYGTDHWRAAGSAWFTYTAVGSTNFFSTSRRAVKTQIQSFDRSAVELINTVDVVEYRYKNDLNNKRIGFIAEDTIEELATQSHDQMDINSSIGLLLKAVQELSSENKQLRIELNQLKTT